VTASTAEAATTHVATTSAAALGESGDRRKGHGSRERCGKNQAG
jgi:hypothetical protein